MRTALYLLFALAASSGIASLLPQRKNEPNVYARFLQNHPFWSSVFGRLGFFDVFGSWWFQLLLVTLIVVLLACLVPRTAALVRQRRSLLRPPRLGPFPEAGHEARRRTRMETPLGADAALMTARRVLRHWRYRLSASNEGRQLVAEKGFARELGSLVFHWSFLVLIVGAALSQGLGFRGQALIVEGDDWAEDVANYTAYAPGRFYADDWHRGFVLHVDSFDVAYRDDATPADFVSHVKVVEGGKVVRNKLLRVNDPLVYGGIKFYQISYGWAPVVRVRAQGETLYEGPVVSLPGGPDGSSEGVVRLPTLHPNAALLLDFYPDPVFAPAGVPGLSRPGPDDGETRPVNLSDVPGGSSGRSFGPTTKALGVPILVARQFQGDLGLTRPQNVYVLDTSRLTRAGGDLLVPKEAEGLLGTLSSTSVALPGGASVEWLDLRRFTVLSVKADPGLPVVGVAAALLLAGLVPSLVAWRRRVWVHVVEGDGGMTLIELGGVAYQRRERFDDEFTALALRLRTQLPPVPERETVP
jgi:cytochrome c biogenesis protein